MGTTVAPRTRRPLVLGVIGVLAILATVGSAVASAAGQASIAQVRAATERFHDVHVAEAAGYGPFYVCTDENGGAGAMGQHYVNGGLVGTASVDPLTPEALVYEPKPGGGQRLVGVEYVVFQDAWDAANDGLPNLFGRDFALVRAGNRYGLPPFYQLHVWLWRPNPSGMFNDWNPKVSCRGNGDPA
jgi:hypothetical protein